MIEPDDRLAGDPVWELFPYPAPAPRSRRLGDWLAVAVLAAAAWAISPALAVPMICVGASLDEFRRAWRLRRAIPDKAGGAICALFGCAWGAWRVGLAALVLVFVAVFIERIVPGSTGLPIAAATAAGLWFAGSLASAILTAAGLVGALRSGMRVWLGEGVNQARTLLMAMVVVGFTCAVLLPACFYLTNPVVVPARDGRGGSLMAGGLFAFLLGWAVGLLLLVDWLGRRVLAARPGKFGAKVPTLEKWAD